QALVALKNRLDVLRRAGDHRAGAVEQDGGTHGSGGRRLDDVVGAPDDQRRERLADELFHERHVLDLHLLLAALRRDLGQAESFYLVLGGEIPLVGEARQQRRAGDPAQGGVFLAVLDGLAVEVLDHGGKVDFHTRSLLADALNASAALVLFQPSTARASPMGLPLYVASVAQ